MATTETVYSGATAIVTGGASGIGRALSQRLAKLGADVTVVDLQTDLAASAACSIKAAGGLAQSATLDITDFEATNALYKSVAARSGKLDFVFNNAGIWMMGNADAFSLDDWNRLINVNLLGTIHGTKAAYDIMMKQKSGHIINTASVAGLIPDPGCTAYSTTKHAIVGLCKSLRVEAARNGVNVSALCPGVVQTPLLDGGGQFGKVFDQVDPDRMHQMWKRMRPMSAEAFAEKSLRDVAKNKAIIVWPIGGKLFWLIDRLSPSLSIKMARNLYDSNQKFMGLV
jgi:NAD(P)-dependent dehydrogenase (short-subunit alcohol dehydrogenase family)